MSDLELLRRPRRLRVTPAMRGLVQETRVDPAQLVLPLFLVEGDGVREPVDGMPGVDRQSTDVAIRAIETAMALGVRAFAIFPRVETVDKSSDGSSAVRDDTLACRALRTVKSHLPEALLIADVALDPYSLEGHDGVVRSGRIMNDETVGVLARMSVLLAQAGADVVAPSDMMDGRVGAIRAELERTGLHDTAILSYAAKYASSFYGPFRGALGSAPARRKDVPSDKSTYQMNPANGREAITEAALDVEEGADILMVKPGLPYLDVVHRLASTFETPIAAYHVSGEYAMLRAAAERGMIDYDAGLAESMLCLSRAGARIIFTYGAVDYARRVRQEDGRA